MTLKEHLGVEIKAAMLAKNANRLNTLRLLKSAIGYVEMERGSDNLSDADFISVVQKEVKKRRDSVAQYQAGNRPELAQKENSEILILEEFLPQPLSSSELEALVRRAIQEAGASSKEDMGKVIKATQAKAAGRAEGKAISDLVARLLPQ